MLPLPVTQAVGILERLMALEDTAPAQVAAMRWRPTATIEPNPGARALRRRLRDALPAERAGLVTTLVQHELGRILGRPGETEALNGATMTGTTLTGTTLTGAAHADVPGWHDPEWGGEWDILRRDVTFHDLGLDSLMAVELRNGLRQATGLDLSSTALFDYPSLPALVEHLDTLLSDIAASGGEDA